MADMRIPKGDLCRDISGQCTHRISHPVQEYMKYCTFFPENGPLRPSDGDDTYKCAACLAGMRENPEFYDLAG